MKIYLINLERSVDRRNYMLSELSKLAPNITINRAACRDIKDTNWSIPKDIQDGRWRSDRWALSPSDIEIFKSHIDCWKKISLSGEIGIVLEYDLIFSKSFTKIIKSLKTKNLNGIIRLDGVNLPLLMSKPITISNEFSISKVNSIAASAAAYAVDSCTAEKLISNIRVERTLDDYLFDPKPSDRGARGHMLPIYQIEPITLVQAQFGNYSDKSSKIPDFLKITKRVDVKRRRSKSLRGPILYRFKKQILRMVYKNRLKKYKKDITNKGGEWKVPTLSNDLSWN